MVIYLLVICSASVVGSLQAGIPAFPLTVTGAEREVVTDLLNPLPIDNRIITGTVTEAQSGQGLPGVNVLEKGTGKGTTTNADGRFRLEVSDQDIALVFSYIGYLKHLNNASGMLLADSLGRGVSWMRPSNHVLYTIWQEDPTDMRNSGFNIRRKWYYNNPASKFFGQEVKYHPNLDTLYHLYPTFRKIEGLSLGGAALGRTFNDWPVMRLAETYLLRAEAHVRKGDQQKAADDINVVRSRAKAKPVTADRVTIDYILDERLRELIVEEPRRLTLNRMGKLVERTKKYNGFPATVNSIQDKNALYPVPQKFIDANFGAVIPQNPGY